MYRTIFEIHQEYDGQWVYLINLKVDERGTVLGGVVAAHNENRDKVVMTISPENGIYIMYAGKVPEEVSVIL